MLGRHRSMGRQASRAHGRAAVLVFPPASTQPGACTNRSRSRRLLTPIFCPIRADLTVAFASRRSRARGLRPLTRRCPCASHGSARSPLAGRPARRAWASLRSRRSLPARRSPDSAGAVVDRAELDALADEIRTHALQIDDDLFIASELPFDDADFVNHSCDPNCGIVGSVLLVTMREVAAGEELCFDYAMTDSDDYDEFVCSCAHGAAAGAPSRAPTGRSPSCVTATAAGARPIIERRSS